MVTSMILLHVQRIIDVVEAVRSIDNVAIATLINRVNSAVCVSEARDAKVGESVVASRHQNEVFAQWRPLWRSESDMPAVMSTREHYGHTTARHPPANHPRKLYSQKS